MRPKNLGGKSRPSLWLVYCLTSWESYWKESIQVWIQENLLKYSSIKLHPPSSMSLQYQLVIYEVKTDEDDDDDVLV